MKGSHPRPADRCPFVLGHIISQVSSFMQLGMLWLLHVVDLPAILIQESTFFAKTNYHELQFRLVMDFISTRCFLLQE